MKKIYFIGFFLIFLGTLIFLSSFSGITGNVVGYTSIDFNLIGFFIVLSGLIIVVISKKSLDDVVIVYRLGDRQNGDDDSNSFMTDPHLHLSRNGRVSLSEFRREIESLREIPGGEELIDLVRDTYVPQLKKIANQGNEEKAEVAKMFLHALDIPYQESSESKGKLPKREVEELKSAFKSYNGTMTRRQLEVIRKHGLTFYPSESGQHPRIGYENGEQVVIAGTPGDWRTGRNISSELIRMINRYRENN